MDRTEVVTSVAGDLHATELAIDAAITQATTLVQSFIGARAALSLSPVSGTMSQAKAMETIAALSCRKAKPRTKSDLTAQKQRGAHTAFHDPAAASCSERSTPAAHAPTLSNRGSETSAHRSGAQ